LPGAPTTRYLLKLYHFRPFATINPDIFQLAFEKPAPFEWAEFGHASRSEQFKAFDCHTATYCDVNSSANRTILPVPTAASGECSRG
jgi:hypothetical protein